jgi:adenylylsulfate kinase-like enzyme
MITWTVLLTGMPNAGKSTIAYNLVQNKLRNTLIIDGDKHRQMQFLGHKLGFTREDILMNTYHVVKMAKFAQDQEMNVLIPQITPYIEQRILMGTNLDNFLEVYCECSLEDRSARPNFRDSELIYEPSANPDLTINTAELSVEECSSAVMELLRQRKLV